MNERVFKYFNAIADKLASEYALTSAIKNSSDIGYAREKLLQSFLANHLPNRLTPVLGGHIFGFNQPDSKQIDIIILNDLGLNFKESEKTFAPIENVGAAFTVKSNLDSKNLIDALTNISSIPQLDKDILIFRNFHFDPFEEFSVHNPSFYVFAYSGMSMSSTLETISDFYKKNNTIPLNRRPRGIIINKEFYIRYNPEVTPTLRGEQVPAYTFAGMELEESFQGYPFFHIFGYINGYAGLVSNMLIDYTKYFNTAMQELYLNTFK